MAWPLPWPRDAGDIDALAPVHEALAGTGIRLQLLVAPERGRAVLYRRADEDSWFAGFTGVERAEQRVHDVVDLVRSGEGDPVVARDVLVCGHGTRDVCCGSLGTALAADVAVAGAVRLWRTSHTGGHRFAPTAIVLPEATVWAYLDPAALAAIVQRHGAVDEHLHRYRGCAGLGSPAAQAVERSALADEGWPVLDRPRRHVDLGGGRTRLEVDELGAWEATVVEGRRLPVPVCGEPIETATKFETELVVRDVARS